MAGDATASDSSTGSKPSDPQIITFNPAAQLPLKLTPTNFASWRSQLETLLMGLDLISYIDGSAAAPSKTMIVDDATVPNPSYHNWFRQDKLILHALRCSIDESIYSFVSAASTSREAWLILEKLYASNAQSRIIHLKGKLAKSVKGNQDILTFVNDLKETAAELALIGEPVKDIDLVVHCLRGLGEAYQSFSAAVGARGPGLTLEDLVDSLVEYEADLKAQQSTAVPTAFYTGQTCRGSFSSSGSPSSPRGGGFPSRQQQQGIGSVYGQGTGFGPDSSQPISPGRRVYSPEPARARRAQFVCQYCERPGHVVRQCFRLFPQARQNYNQLQSAPSAHVPTRSAQDHATTASSPGPWLMDSAASHHVTVDLGQLSLYSDYAGPDEITVGDGSGSSHGGAAAEGGKQR
ncbi:unnamed protein product [Linum trigynum]|uniref:Retrotransposon Copia-like N-terminal domain-containing protein n=1 Tax=Linum trigynum TaxID=586398 RepID=A0AAV2D0U9_9ROSI